MNGTNETNGDNKSKSAKGNIPKADLDLATTATNVADNWRTNTDIVLKWTSVDYFTQKTAEYQNTLTERISAGGKRPIISKKLSDLDKEIDKGTIFLKDYLKELYGNNDISHYNDYGIVKTKSGFRIPADRDIRIAALTQILEALQNDGLQNKTYGTTFWQAIKTEYLTLKSEKSELDEVLATKVSEKNALKNELNKHLLALVYVIKGNYPDTYKAELRAWGFQKEKY